MLPRARLVFYVTRSFRIPPDVWALVAEYIPEGERSAAVVEGLPQGSGMAPTISPTVSYYWPRLRSSLYPVGVRISVGDETVNVVLDLAPDIAATVQAQAAAGCPRLGESLCKLAEQATVASSQHRVSLEEFERDLDAFSEGTEGLPELSGADLSRAAMYADHD